MAQIVVKRTNGEKVTLILGHVDRQKRHVAISIPAFNARIIFSDIGGKTTVIDRQKINDSDPATIHVSQSVYTGMARWAGSILSSQR